MTSLTVFNFQGQDVRFVGTADHPEWIAQDVCVVLEIVNHRDALADFDHDEKGDVVLTDAIGRKQKMLTVKEPGLYRLIFQSRKAEARKFQKWVFSDVLPQIRKTGKYATDMPPEGVMSLAELQAYSKELQKSGMLKDKYEKSKYATEVSKTFAWRTGTEPINHTILQFKVLETDISEYQVLLDKIVELAKRLDRPISARDMIRNFHAFRKIASPDVRKMFQKLADTGNGSVAGTAKDLKYIHLARREVWKPRQFIAGMKHDTSDFNRLQSFVVLATT